MRNTVATAFLLVAFLTATSDGRRLESFNKIRDVLDETSKLLQELKDGAFEDKQHDEVDCKDIASQCSVWKEKAGDKWTHVCENREFVQERCAKTCELCGSTTAEPSQTTTEEVTEMHTDEGTEMPTEEGTETPTEEGTEMPTAMTTEITGDCEDVSPKCSEWKEKAGDKWTHVCENREFVQERCAKTCELCGSGSQTTEEPRVTTEEPQFTTEEPQVTTELPGGTTDGGVQPPPTTDTPEEGSGSTLVSDLEKCTESNKGHCECADTSKGFQTYVFKIDDTTRCFTVFHPQTRASEKLPVVVSSQCYGKDRLSGIQMISDTKGGNAAASRYGFARVGLSTPDGHWTFGNDGIVNDQNPMPCSDSDSKDITYVKKVFQFLESNADKFDSNRIYTEGFSQNSMFSAYIGFCFSDKVVGIWQGGSGLAYTGEGPNLPGCQAQCAASVFATSTSCNQCKANTPCTTCQYWPIYPCYQAKRPVIDCVADYKNDYIASDRNDPENFSTAKNMYETLVNEGHDARLLRFEASANGTIPGGHQNPKNTEYWQVGCLGITASCSTQCESSFKQCMGSSFSDAAARVSKFEACMEEESFAGLNGCTADCAPTFGMLSESESPVESEFSRNVFGANSGSDTDHQKPVTSKCSAA